jgi:hypothetical protein
VEGSLMGVQTVKFVIAIGTQVKFDDDWFDLLCLTPLSAIFQLYHGDQF